MFTLTRTGMSNISQSVTSLRSLKFSRRAHPRSSTPAFPKNPVPAYRVFERRPAERFAGAPPSGIGRRTKTFTGEAGGTKRPRDYGLRDYCDRRCSGGKPVAHPLHRYITYEKWRFRTRYITVTCRYTGLRITGPLGPTFHRGETGGTPVTPLHYL